MERLPQIISVVPYNHVSIISEKKKRSRKREVAVWEDLVQGCWFQRWRNGNRRQRMKVASSTKRKGNRLSLWLSRKQQSGWHFGFTQWHSFNLTSRTVKCILLQATKPVIICNSSKKLTEGHSKNWLAYNAQTCWIWKKSKKLTDCSQLNDSNTRGVMVTLDWTLTT